MTNRNKLESIHQLILNNFTQRKKREKIGQIFEMEFPQKCQIVAGVSTTTQICM